MRHVLIATALAFAPVVTACSSHDSPSPTPAPPPTPPLPPPSHGDRTAIVDVTVVPMDRERELPHQTVVVEGERIVSLDDASRIDTTGMHTIDGRGKWLIPGLADMHVHYNEATYAPLFVAHGVTFVRNMAGDAMMLGIRERTRRGELIGPTMITAGPITDGDPPFWPGSDIVAKPADAEPLVAAQKAAGYDFVKVYNDLTKDAYAAVVAAAARHGLPVEGHVPTAVGIDGVIAAHQKSLEHMYGWITAAASKPAPSTLGWLDQVKWLQDHFDASKLPALARAAKDAGVWNCPTFVVNDRYAHLDDIARYAKLPEMRYAAPETELGWDPSRAGLPTDKRGLALQQAAYALDEKVVKALADAGAGILAGTDVGNPWLVPGASLHEELGRLVAAGLTPYQALAAATSEPARFLGREADMGTVAVGRHADLVLLDGDPLASIASTSHIAGVVLHGRWFARADLDKLLANVIASFRTPTDWLRSPAPVPPGKIVFDGTYAVRRFGSEIGRERLVIVRRDDGSLVASSDRDERVPMRRRVTARAELDAKRAVRSLHIAVDGHDVGVGHPALPDSDALATWVVVAAQLPAKGHAAIAATRVELDGRSGPETADLYRTIAMTAGFTMHRRYGDIRGDLDLDDHGELRDVSWDDVSGDIDIYRLTP